MLDVSNLNVAIGSVQILRNVSLHVPRGAACSIVGHNGAGKTTLLRAIVGLLPSSGQILIAGRDVTRAPAMLRAQAGVGYMPEDRKLVPELSVRDNIALPAEVNDPTSLNQRLEEAFALVPELIPLAQRKATQLSGGQQKLAALARAIVYGRAMLLLDEPFEGIAPVLIERLRDVLASLRRSGRTIVISASEYSHVDGLADIELQIERGEITGSSRAADRTTRSVLPSQTPGGVVDP